MTAPAQAIAAEPPSPAIAASVEAAPIFRADKSLLKAHLELGKVRLNAMVVFTTALGYVVGSRLNYWESINWPRLFWTCFGTFLAAVGASAFNQAIEARRDARMKRTRNRPLPTGVLSRTYAATFGLIISIVGVAIICPTSNGLTAVLAASNVLIYVALYTPLKPASTINTLVGAVVGGIPPMLGWTAARGSLDAGAWVLGGILFFWQIPHFLALAWLYREDYARGGFKMLPWIDPSGRLTSRLALIYGMALMPLCLAMVYFGNAGLPFALISLVLTGGLIACAIRFTQTRANKEARRLFFASIIYLPILSVALMIDARGPADAYLAVPAGYVLPASNGDRFIDPGDPAAQAIIPAPASPHGHISVNPAAAANSPPASPTEAKAQP